MEKSGVMKSLKSQCLHEKIMKSNVTRKYLNGSSIIVHYP